jgi:hypothetical protein
MCSDLRIRNARICYHCKLGTAAFGSIPFPSAGVSGCLPWLGFGRSIAVQKPKAALPFWYMPQEEEGDVACLISTLLFVLFHLTFWIFDFGSHKWIYKCLQHNMHTILLPPFQNKSCVFGLKVIFFAFLAQNCVHCIALTKHFPAS